MPYKTLSVLCLTFILCATTWAGTATFIVKDDMGNPMPARVHLRHSNDTQPKFLKEQTEYPYHDDHIVFDGQATIDMPADTYTFSLERSPEFTRTSGTITIKEDSHQSVSAILTRITDLKTEGWWSGELHIHRPVEHAELLMRAGDLHVGPVITWWNQRNLWQGKKLPKNPLVAFDENRFIHLLGGEDERNFGAILYHNMTKPIDIIDDQKEFPSPYFNTAEAAAQESNLWLDIEKPFWWDVPTMLALGIGDSIGILNNHMCHSRMLDNEAWGYARHTGKYPSPLGNGFYSQDLYYRILNTGIRIPPSAGSASGVLPNPVGYNRVYVHLDGPLSYEAWWEGLRAGRSFVTNGPLLRAKANSRLPGHVFKSSGDPLQIDLEVELDSFDPLTQVEVVHNGEVILSAEAQALTQLGYVEFTESGWFLIRVRADVDNTFRFASTAPYYVEIGDEPTRVSKKDATFFADWVEERISRIAINDSAERKEVLQYHQNALDYWRDRAAKANAE